VKENIIFLDLTGSLENNTNKTRSVGDGGGKNSRSRRINVTDSGAGDRVHLFIPGGSR